MLSFEDFSRENPGDEPGYGNFFAYFYLGRFIRSIYQEAAHYKRFALENPGMSASLCERVTSEFYCRPAGFSESLKRELYVAYTIMRSYDGVTDKDLLS